jgi:hypothetical protein
MWIYKDPLQISMAYINAHCLAVLTVSLRLSHVSAMMVSQRDQAAGVPLQMPQANPDHKLNYEEAITEGHTSSLKANSPSLLNIAIAPVDANSAAIAGRVLTKRTGARMDSFSSVPLRVGTPNERFAERHTERERSPPAVHRFNICAIATRCKDLVKEILRCTRLTMLNRAYTHSTLLALRYYATKM